MDSVIRMRIRSHCFGFQQISLVNIMIKIFFKEQILKSLKYVVHRLPFVGVKPIKKK